MKHSGPVSGVAAFRDQFVATAGYDNQVILWDLPSRRSLERVYHDHLANQCAFSPCGRYLVSSSSDYSARLWEIPAMRLRTVLRGHSDDVEMAAFSPNSRYVATCSRDGTIQVFSDTGERIGILSGHTRDVISVSWSTNSASLLSSSDDGTVRRWDIKSLRQADVIDVGGVETDTVVALGDAVIAAGNDHGDILVVDKGGIRTTPAHQAGIKRLVVDRDRLISLSYDRTAIIWQVTDTYDLVRLTRMSIPDVVWPRSAAFAGANSLVFGTFGSSFAVYDIPSDRWDLSHIQRDASLNALALSGGALYAVGDAGTVFRDGQPTIDLESLCNFVLPFGNALLTGGQAGILWDAHTGTVLHTHSAPLNCGAVFHRSDSQWAIIGTYTGHGLLFRATADGLVNFEGEIKLHDNAVKGLASSHTVIFSVCATGSVAWHSIADLAVVQQKANAHARIANGCVALADGRFASVGRDLKLRLWNGDLCETHDTPHHHSIKCVAVSTDGNQIATGSYTGHIEVFDLQTRQWSKSRRPTASGVSCIIAGRLDRQFLATSYDGRIHAIDL